MIQIRSCDGKIINVKKELALYSKTIKTFIDSNINYEEYQADVLYLPIKGKILVRVVDFLIYKSKNKNVDEFEIYDDETAELLDAAAYLQI